jgi:predicted CoA-substrate-specific enzyme activase
MYSIGIDSGSVATKGVLFNGDICQKIIIPTGWNPKESSKAVLDQLIEKADGNIQSIIGTGYGRVSMDFTDRNVTEITCHAAGAVHLISSIDTVLDIGGQDSKVIGLNNKGQVKKFIMNDKCAAGTGVFLQETLTKLGISIDVIDSFEPPENPVVISNMCAVFASSEIVSMLAKGVNKNQIVHGIINTIAQRAANQLEKVNTTGEILFTGGLSQSELIREKIEEKVNRKVHSLKDSQFAGAIGAAKIALK